MANSPSNDKHERDIQAEDELVSTLLRDPMLLRQFVTKACAMERQLVASRSAVAATVPAADLEEACIIALAISGHFCANPDEWLRGHEKRLRELEGIARSVQRGAVNQQGCSGSNGALQQSGGSAPSSARAWEEHRIASASMLVSYCMNEGAKRQEDPWLIAFELLNAPRSATRLPEEPTEEVIEAMAEGYTAHFENPKMVIGENMKNVYRALVAHLRAIEGATKNGG